VTEAQAAAASGEREMVEGFAKGVKYALFFANVIIFVSNTTSSFSSYSCFPVRLFSQVIADAADDK
jgi:hypothetical protein